MQEKQNQVGEHSLSRDVSSPMSTIECAEPLPDVLHPAPDDAVGTSVQDHLLHIASSLMSIRAPAPLLREIVFQTVQALSDDIDSAILWLQDKRTGKLRVHALYSTYLSTEAHTALENLQLTYGEAFAGYTFQQGAFAHVEGRANYIAFADTITAHNVPYVQQLTQHLPLSLNAACLPLHTTDQSQALGVLELLCLTPSALPHTKLFANNPEIIHTLQTFTHIITTTITNAHLFDESDRQCHRLKLFDAIVTAISGATDLQNLLSSVLHVVMDMLPISSAALFLLDEDQEHLLHATSQGLPGDYIASLCNTRIAETPCHEAIHHGQPTMRPLIDERGESALLATGLQTCAYLPFLAGGTVVGVLGIYSDDLLHKRLDITTLTPLSNQVGFAIANIRLYQASRKEHRKLHTVINSITEGILLCDKKGRIVLSNQAASALLNLDALPFHQPLSDIAQSYNIRDLEGVPLTMEQLPMAQALAGFVFYDYRLLMHGASGPNTAMSFSGSPTHTDEDGSIEGAVLVFRDITTNQKLERAKDEFLTIAAHELRSPLASVRGYSDMLLKRERERNEAHSRDLRGLTILSQQVTHMLRMVDNLLDISRLDAGCLEMQTQSVNLVSLISQVLDQQRFAAGTRELTFTTDHIELVVSCDPLRMRQVLTNLVGNAIKYSPPESQITVSLSTCQNPHQEAIIAVIDQGGGIPPEHQPHLFKRFYRARSRRVEGLGLGLYLSREFILMHGGHIWVECVQGQSTTFYVTLPVQEVVGDRC